MANTYFIVVRVPESKDTVFIARPFSQGFDDVGSAIEKAVSRVGLRPSATDINPEDVNFIKDIVQKIREARIVVAVCSPEHDTAKANPNVMYELGFAHSIGKSTVILTTSIETLPSDLQGQNVLTYKESEERTREFLNNIEVLLNQAKERSEKNKTTDTSSYRNIWAAGAKHWLIINPDLCNEFMAILSFAKETHHRFQYLEKTHLEPLHRSFEEIGICFRSFTPEILIQKRVDFKRTWNEFVLYSSYFKQECLSPLLRDIDKVERAFESLLPKADSRTKRLIEQSKKESFKKISRQLQTYPEAQNKLEEMYADTHKLDDILSSLNKEKIDQEFWGKLEQLLMIAKQLIMNSDNLISQWGEILKAGKQDEKIPLD